MLIYLSRFIFIVLFLKLNNSSKKVLKKQIYFLTNLMKRAIPMIFLIVFESIADISAKKWADNQVFWYSVIAI